MSHHHHHYHNVTDDNFDSNVLESDLPVLVDFWAPWCGPCKMIGPIVEELAKDYDGKVKICKINVDENPETAGKFGIRSIPTLMMFKDGELVETKVGGANKMVLVDLINKHL